MEDEHLKLFISSSAEAVRSLDTLTGIDSAPIDLKDGMNVPYTHIQQITLQCNAQTAASCKWSDSFGHFRCSIADMMNKNIAITNYSSSSIHEHHP